MIVAHIGDSEREALVVFNTDAIVTAMLPAVIIENFIGEGQIEASGFDCFVAVFAIALVVTV